MTGYTLKPNGKGSLVKGRPRKTLQSVDTNLSSYDRTDPFLAFNVLRKLLGALPSRFGGCQYKVFPEEHKLSMHLLSILEPFVGVAHASRRTITRQPTEVLDSIVFHVDSKSDLLSLGLSCRRLYSVVFPRHYEYRHIRCKVSSIRVWNHLIVHRSLARNVGQLEIIDERSTDNEVIPFGISTSDTDLESTDDELGLHTKQERYLVSALTKMSALQSFVWSCNHSPISIENVWPTLLKCRSLKVVEINDNLIFNPSTEEAHTVRHILPEIKTVALRSTKHIYGSTKHPEMSRISGMLNQCPNLESLDIGYNRPRGPGYVNPTVDDILLCSRWPCLTSLSLTNLRCSPDGGLDAAATFLGAHVNLEILHLDFGSAGSGSGRPRLLLPPNSLPRLRELRSNKDIANSILECQCDPPRPLETLRGVKLSGSTWDQIFLANLKKCGMGIKRIELMGWHEMDEVKKLAECVPKLSWLDLGKRECSGTGLSAVHSNPAGPMMHANVVEWAAILTLLPDLATFHGIRFFYEVSTSDPPCILAQSDRSRVRKNDEIASVLAWKCPKLRRLDHWEEGSGKVIVLLRDGEKFKVKYEIRRVKS